MGDVFSGVEVAKRPVSCIPYAMNRSICKSGVDRLMNSFQSTINPPYLFGGVVPGKIASPVGLEDDIEAKLIVFWFKI